jgi:hypothetical protein
VIVYNSSQWQEEEDQEEEVLDPAVPDHQALQADQLASLHRDRPNPHQPQFQVEEWVLDYWVLWPKEWPLELVQRLLIKPSEELWEEVAMRLLRCILLLRNRQIPSRTCARSKTATSLSASSSITTTSLGAKTNLILSRTARRTCKRAQNSPN